MKFLVYKGEGVSPFSLRQTLSSLKAALPEASVSVIDAPTLAEGSWANQTTLLAVPGGRDVFYHKALKGRANTHIRNFVEQGGAYLGLCAGAYYASSKVIFEQGGPLEVVEERELSFFPGETIGPLFEQAFTYQSEESAESAQVMTDAETFSCYYNGGCLFEGVEGAPNTEVLASYRDLPGRPPAIIRCAVGKGRALLSGVHLEHAYAGLKRRPLPSELLSRFEASEEVRRRLFDRLVASLAKPNWNGE